MQDSKLGNIIRKSSILLGSASIADRSVAFLSKVLMVKIVLPEEIGVAVLLISMAAMFESFTDLGIRQSIIQNRSGGDFDFINTSWWINGIKSIILFGLGWFLVPVICDFYFKNNPNVLAIRSMEQQYLLARLSLLGVLFNGFVNPRVFVLEKELKFSKSVMIFQGSAILGSVLTIILVYISRNLNAIVMGFLLTGFVRLVVSFAICNYTPIFRIDRKSLRAITKFTKGYFGLAALTYVSLNIDVFVAGKYVSAELLGMYGMLIVLARIPNELFSRILTPILLPVYSKVQSDKKNLLQHIVLTTKLMVLFVTPAILFAAILNKEILVVLFREEYGQVAVPFAILCVYTLFHVAAVILTIGFFSIGKPEKQRIYIIIRSILLIVSIYPLTIKYGLVGTSVSVFISGLISLVVQVLTSRILFNLKLNQYLKSYAPGVLAGCFTAVLLLVIKGRSDTGTHLVLIMSTLVLVITYILAYLLEKRAIPVAWHGQLR